MLDWSYSCKIAFVRGNLAYCPWKCTWDSNPTIDMRTKKKALLCHVLCIWSKPREIPKKNISVRRKVCWSTASSLRRRCRHWSKRLYLFLCFAKVAPIPLSVHSRYCPDLLKSKLFDRLQFRESCRRQLAQISAVSYAACFVRQSFIAVLRSSQPLPSVSWLLLSGHSFFVHGTSSAAEQATKMMFVELYIGLSVILTSVSTDQPRAMKILLFSCWRCSSTAIISKNLKSNPMAKECARKKCHCAVIEIISCFPNLRFRNLMNVRWFYVSMLCISVGGRASKFQCWSFRWVVFVVTRTSVANVWLLHRVVMV